MPTGLSWPEGDVDSFRRAVTDVRHLLWFRAATVRRRRTAAVALVSIAVVTILSAVLPAWLTLDRDVLSDAARLLPAALAAVLGVSLASAIGGGGGREVLARDPASIHPISPMTDHLGALALAPLNAAWLIQTWALLAFSAMVAGPSRLLGAQLLTLAWVLAVTVVAQAVAWGVEWIRRGPRGVRTVRIVIGISVLTLAAVGAVPDARTALVAGPAGTTSAAIQRGGVLTVVTHVLALLVVTVLFVAIGARLAEVAARRMPRDEGHQETRSHPGRATPTSDLAMMRRMDRASIWRSVPLRRGTYLLALAPGVVALAGGLEWSTLILMPGLVASGCVLLFGVNMWCLDGRGMLWRETLPIRPRQVLVARAWVLAEVLLGAGTVTVVLGGIRAGAPTSTELLAVVLALVVVVGQSVSAALRWSARSPYAVDLRSARATPAPPLAMVGYSMRLALATTFTGLFFSAMGVAGRSLWLVALAAILLSVSAVRIWLAARRWSDPVKRAAVVAVVAA